MGSLEQEWLDSNPWVKVQQAFGTFPDGGMKAAVEKDTHETPCPGVLSTCNLWMQVKEGWRRPAGKAEVRVAHQASVCTAATINASLTLITSPVSASIYSVRGLRTFSASNPLGSRVLKQRAFPLISGSPIWQTDEMKGQAGWDECGSEFSPKALLHWKAGFPGMEVLIELSPSRPWGWASLPCAICLTTLSPRPAWRNGAALSTLSTIYHDGPSPETREVPC